MRNLDLFNSNPCNAIQTIGDGVVFLSEFALSNEQDLLTSLHQLVALSPFTKMYTPSGLAMSVTTTSCGLAGWVSDAYGYRYSKKNPSTNLPWPQMPESFLQLAQQAADTAGYKNFVPDSCLINRYQAGAKMSLHQDKNEKDFSQPIVSVSLGLPATFLFGGLAREDKTIRLPLEHGDVVVWGGPARLFFHGVLPIKAGKHPGLGEQRINLTFRKAL